MSVKRYEPVEYSDHLGMCETEHGGYVDFEDYDSLRAQLEKVEAEKEAILQQARCWASEAKTQRHTVNTVGSILGGIPDWGPIAEGVRKRIDDAYQRGAREMRERAAKECDLMALCWDREHRTQRDKAQSYDYAAFSIRALPDTLPTGPSESAKV